MTRHPDTPPSDGADVPLATTAEVAAVVEDVQRARRGGIHWGIGRRTAELALRALDERERPTRRSSKSRRRKRHKRML